MLRSIGHRCVLDGFDEEWMEILPSDNDDTIRIFSHNKKGLNIESTRFRYIDVSSEDDMKREFLYDGLNKRTYLVLDEDITIKNKYEGYKNYKAITEKYMKNWRIYC